MLPLRLVRCEKRFNSYVNQHKEIPLRDGKTVEAINQDKFDRKNPVLLMDVTESPTLCVVAGYLLLFSACLTLLHGHRLPLIAIITKRAIDHVKYMIHSL